MPSTSMLKSSNIRVGLYHFLLGAVCRYVIIASARDFAMFSRLHTASIAAFDCHSIGKPLVCVPSPDGIILDIPLLHF